MTRTHLQRLLDLVNARLATLAAARALYSEQVAPDYNVFDFFHPTELKLSSILRWLLDPNGSHAQGTSFLEAYLRRLGVDWSHLDLASAAASTEAPAGGGRRIDVLLSGRGFAIAIENKPFDAPDQENQVLDYLQFLDKAEHRCLVYLARLHGRQPSARSISKRDLELRLSSGELKITSYSDLRGWLTSCRATCRADRVRAFIDDFERYILREFEGMVDSTEQREVVASITATTDSIEAAAKIAAAWEAARDEMLKLLQIQLTTHAPPGWIVEGSLGRKGETLRIRAAELLDYSFAVSFDAVRHRDFVYGLVSSQKAAATRLARLARSELGAGDGEGVVEGWVWWKYAAVNDPLVPVTSDWSSAAEPWVSVRDGSLATHLIRAARHLSKVLAAARSPDATTTS